MTVTVWRRSSRCASESACVEVAVENGLILVRDSKDPNSPVLRFTPAEFGAFLAGAKAGEFDGLVSDG